MKKEKIVIAARGLGLVLYFLTFLSTPAFSQIQEEDMPAEDTPNILGIFSRIGFGFGLGTNSLNLTPLNERLSSLDIQNLYSTMPALNVGLSFSSKAGDELMFAYINSPSVVFSGDTHLSLTSESFAMNVYKSLLKKERLGLQLLTGMRETVMNFEYNNNRTRANSFNSLFDNQGQDLKHIQISSRANSGIVLGGRLLYQLGKKDNKKPFLFDLGLESGYSYYFIRGSWKETGSAAYVADMPTLKPDNFFVNLSFNGRFKL